MPRRFFRKFAFKRHHMSEQWFMSPFQHLLHDTRLWGIRRRWVVPAFALGLFVAFLPFPGHMLISALAALALRVNIPVAALSTWASNPLTIGPMYYFAYLTIRDGAIARLGDTHVCEYLAADAIGKCTAGQYRCTCRLCRAGPALAPVAKQLQGAQTKPAAR